MSRAKKGEGEKWFDNLNDEEKPYPVVTQKSIKFSICVFFLYHEEARGLPVDSKEVPKLPSGQFLCIGSTPPIPVRCNMKSSKCKT
jgi:hypothetical protein